MNSTHFWIVSVGFAFIAGALFIGKGGISGIFPYILILLCPVAMLFMMRDHKH